MVPERCFGDDKEIMLARGEINFLDLDPRLSWRVLSPLDCAWERP
jgi:hypothetical protein